LIGGALGWSQRSSLRILEFGGGDGWWSRYFAWEFGGDVVCFDPSTSFTYFAQREFNRERIGRTQRESRVLFTDDLSDVEGEFDVVICFLVLAHVIDNDLHKTLEIATKSLKKGGRFISFETTGSMRTLGNHWIRRTEDEYLRLFAEFDLCALEIHRYQRSLFGLAVRYLLDPVRRRYFQNDAVRYYSLKSVRLLEGALFRILSHGKAPNYSRDVGIWNALYVLQKA